MDDITISFLYAIYEKTEVKFCAIDNVPSALVGIYFTLTKVLTLSQLFFTKRKKAEIGRFLIY